jgi:hypothetical protein
MGATLVAGLLGAAPASASASVSATCGLSGTLNTSPPVQLLTSSSGTYTFNNVSMSCQGTIDGVRDVFTNDLSTWGNYIAQDCTAQIFDSNAATATVATSIAGNVGKTFSFIYRINSAAGWGQIWFLPPSKGIGTLAVIPNALQVNTACTNQFAVAGEFVLSVP